MDFRPDDDHDLIRQGIRKLCGDFPDTYWARCDAEHSFPDEFYRAMADGGWVGLTLPERFGGGGRGITEASIVLEEVAASGAAMNGCSAVHSSMFGMQPVVLHGSEALRERYLPAVAAGDLHIAFGITEPDAGSDTTSISTRAWRENGHYVVRGAKVWTTKAHVSEKVLLLVRTTPREECARRTDGLTLLLADLHRPEVDITPIDKIGYFGLTTFHLWFDGLRVPVRNRVGSLGEGPAPKGKGAFNATLHGLNIARIHTAARAIGLARGAVEDALAYAKTRVQFDRPIASFQAIRFKLADMATEVEAARAFMYQVAQQCDDGLPVEREAAMVKLFATEMAERVTSAGLQVHGGNGYTTEYAVQRHWRDARLTTIFEGTSEIQRRIISDRLLGERST